MTLRQINAAFKWFFDTLARGLVRIHCTANVVTFVGFLITCAAGWCLAQSAGAAWDGGPNPWLLVAGFLMIASAFCDFLDGKVARLGVGETKFGAFWDSTLDRLSDTALLGGTAWYFLLRGNITFVVLSISALAASVTISYARSRAEHVIKECKVGYWQRPERLVGLNLAVFFHKIPAFMVLMGLTIWWSVLSRIWYTWRQTRAETTGVPIRRDGFWYHVESLLFWYYPRKSVVYFVVTILSIAAFALIPLTPAHFDPLRHWANLP